MRVLKQFSCHDLYHYYGGHVLMIIMAQFYGIYIYSILIVSILLASRNSDRNVRYSGAL
jgi:hypothetical protein